MPAGRRANRSGDYRSARIGAGVALTGAFLMIVLADILSLTYEANLAVLLALLGTILGLFGLEARSILGGRE